MADRAYLERLTRELLETGQPIAAGFAVARLAGTVPADATPEQLEQFRMIFFAAAQHLWSTLFASLDADREPTQDECRRMSIVHHELETWANEQGKKHGFAQQHSKGGHA